jgi:catechol 2,3-dioxygenase-like lactoylglutathione lyase family enzyme
MPVKNISHIAIGVRDMDASLPFWTDVVGLHVSLDATEEFTMDGRLTRRRGVYLREQEGANEPFIVLDQGLTTPYEGEPTPLFQIGVHHFGFWVDDLDAIWARARAAAVTIVTEPSQGGVDTPAYGEPSGGRVRSMFVRDPDGNTVQFDQRVS